MCAGGKRRTGTVGGAGTVGVVGGGVGVGVGVGVGFGVSVAVGGGAGGGGVLSAGSSHSSEEGACQHGACACGEASASCAKPTWLEGRWRGDGGEMEGRWRADGGQMEGRYRGAPPPDSNEP